MTFERIHQLILEDIVYWGLDPSGVYYRWSVNCFDPLGNNIGGSIEYWESSPPVDPTVLRDNAAARINPDPPSVESNPPFNEPGRFGIVNLPTWLWINDPWETIGPESETAGFVTVEVSATPLTVDWKMGDGGAANCGGPGIAWSEATHSGGTYCSYTYTSSSADQDGAKYAAEATQLWEFEWWINGVYQGVFGTLERDTPFSLAIGEIQAVEGDRD